MIRSAARRRSIERSDDESVASSSGRPPLRRMLDTNVCIHVIRRRPPDVLRRFEDYEVGEIGVSSVTVAELHYGA